MLTARAPAQGPRRVGRYLLCDQIGSGGMATIHLARLLGPQGFSRTVAVKQLHPQFAQNPQFVAMLLDEARLAVRVRHGNVVSPLDIVATESELFIVMDYVHGESLANLLVAAAGPLRPAFAAAVLVQALLGLHAAHEATREQGDALGLVHRDVSPQNIQVGHDGVARIVDFGIAKAVARTQTTDGGMVKGKLGYMAPEQIRLEVIDRRTDVFSAGVVLWEALTGTGLFVADALGASIEQILHAEISAPSRYNPEVSPELDAVVLKALDRNRDTRFRDALSMAAALQRATPVASALEVIDWLEGLAGPELGRRAELVKRVEALSWEPALVTQPQLRAPSEPRATLARIGRAETVAVMARPLRRTPTLLGLAASPEEPGAADAGVPDGDAERVQESGSARSLLAPSEAAGLGEPVAVASRNNAAVDSVSAAVGSASAALVATGVSTGIALGGDRALAARGGMSQRRSRSRRLALGLALAAVCAGCAVLLLYRVQRSAPGLGALSAPLEPAAVSSRASSPVPLGAGSDVAAEPLAASPSGPLVRPVLEDLTGVTSWAEAELRTAEADRASGATRASRAAPSGRSRAAGRGASASGRRAAKASAANTLPASGGLVVEGRSRARAAASSAGSPRANGCNPPWVVNEQQVKVFKAECLR